MLEESQKRTNETRPTHGANPNKLRTRAPKTPMEPNKVSNKRTQEQDSKTKSKIQNQALKKNDSPNKLLIK